MSNARGDRTSDGSPSPMRQRALPPGSRPTDSAAVAEWQSNLDAYESSARRELDEADATGASALLTAARTVVTELVEKGHDRRDAFSMLLSFSFGCTRNKSEVDGWDPALMRRIGFAAASAQDRDFAVRVADALERGVHLGFAAELRAVAYEKNAPDEARHWAQTARIIFREQRWPPSPDIDRILSESPKGQPRDDETPPVLLKTSSRPVEGAPAWPTFTGPAVALTRNQFAERVGVPSRRLKDWIAAAPDDSLFALARRPENRLKKRLGGKYTGVRDDVADFIASVWEKQRREGEKAAKRGIDRARDHERERKTAFGITRSPTDGFDRLASQLLASRRT